MYHVPRAHFVKSIFGEPNVSEQGKKDCKSLANRCGMQFRGGRKIFTVKLYSCYNLYYILVININMLISNLLQFILVPIFNVHLYQNHEINVYRPKN